MNCPPGTENTEQCQKIHGRIKIFLVKFVTCSCYGTEICSHEWFSLGNGAMNARRYWKRRNERFGILENATMNAPRYWKRRNKHSALLATVRCTCSTMLLTARWCLERCWVEVETSANTLSALQTGNWETQFSLLKMTQALPIPIVPRGLFVTALQ
jgi:hypothetical protein